MFEFETIRELYEMVINGSLQEQEALQYVELEGWVKTNRCNGQIGFIALNDGTYFKNAQIVYLTELENFDEVKKLRTGTALKVLGKFKLTPDGKQPFEIEATKVEVEGECVEEYPLQKKRHTMEFLRDIPHLRPRTNTFMAVFRVRSVASYEIHKFFQEKP